MQRLTGQTPQELESRRIDATRGWAKRWGAVVVLKGAPTVVACPDGRVSVNPTGSPALASAGTGDVLTGTLVALLAQGLAPYDAARIALSPAHSRSRNAGHSVALHSSADSTRSAIRSNFSFVPALVILTSFIIHSVRATARAWQNANHGEPFFLRLPERRQSL